MKASERVEVEALRSLFDVPEPRGVLREAGGAIAIRVDGLPLKELNRIAGLYDLDDLEDSKTSPTAGRTGSRSTPRRIWTTSWRPEDKDAGAEYGSARAIPTKAAS